MRSLGIPKLAWRKGSAWNALIRVHATIVAEDVRVFDALKKGCRDDEGKFILILVWAIFVTSCFIYSYRRSSSMCGRRSLRSHLHVVVR
jgi:hypothetical protein